MCYAWEGLLYISVHSCAKGSELLAFHEAPFLVQGRRPGERKKKSQGYFLNNSEGYACDKRAEGSVRRKNKKEGSKTWRMPAAQGGWGWHRQASSFYVSRRREKTQCLCIVPSITKIG
ncbi:unnamed protein product, partial [Polarella glacialis]